MLSLGVPTCYLFDYLFSNNSDSGHPLKLEPTLLIASNFEAHNIQLLLDFDMGVCLFLFK